MEKCLPKVAETGIVVSKIVRCEVQDVLKLWKLPDHNVNLGIIKAKIKRTVLLFLFEPEKAR